MPFPFATKEKFVGDIVPIVIVRDGCQCTGQLVLCGDAHDPWKAKEAPSLRDYVILGGFVFVRRTQQFLRAEFGSSWRAETCRGLRGDPALENQEVVVVADVLPHTINDGYACLKMTRLLSFRANPKSSYEPVLGLRHFAEMVKNFSGDTFDFILQGEGPQHGDISVILNRNETEQCEAKLLSSNGIASAYSLAEKLI